VSVIIEKEESAIFFDRAAKVAAELMEMVGRFRRGSDHGVEGWVISPTRQRSPCVEGAPVREQRGPSACSVFQSGIIAQAVGIERAVPVKVECRSVEFIRS